MQDNVEKLRLLATESVEKAEQPKRVEFLTDPTLSLAAIGDKLGETHSTAIDIRADLLSLKVEADAHIKKAVNEIATALDTFNKEMDATIEKLNKLIGA